MTVVYIYDLFVETDFLRLIKNAQECLFERDGLYKTHNSVPVNLYRYRYLFVELLDDKRTIFIRPKTDYRLRRVTSLVDSGTNIDSKLHRGERYKVFVHKSQTICPSSQQVRLGKNPFFVAQLDQSPGIVKVDIEGRRQQRRGGRIVVECVGPAFVQLTLYQIIYRAPEPP